ncbi:lipopolysaccharide n-acetylglucosaminyltransferase [Brucella melitensis bv. 1 str. 16M]|uniref:Lipopolysaccharide n-acetylglucosaminyltransferase n=1 Tax=Brucella melitensis biotype 1 (strain ATCC 23456 / CCUG 17765 / NCTC 10094 / 16M) TaxID=224914 RepID=Q8YBQ0_BRUME|nr:glycosyltransferase [Brucella melitensis]AAL54087.1 lipopolysaccharide n-acetylglucosaminyltransferase [Brucella melitensis bv. 1 str. 16M]
MKIIHVIGSYDPAKGGPQAVVVRLAAAQASLGHRVTIVSYSDDAVSRRAAEATAMIPDFDKVQTLLLPMPDIYETFTGGHTANAVTALIRGADFVHLHGIWETNLLRASMLCRRFHIPYCVCCCGMLDGAAFIHALNRDEIELMRPLGLKAPSLVIPNGVFLNEVEVGDMDVPGLPARRFILFLSRLHYKKRLDILADAYCRIAPHFRDVDLVVAGPDGGAEDAFRRKIAEYGLQHRVHMPGGLYGLAKIAALKRAACFCLPSRQEGFSVAITEALACGAPVVITDACHFPEVGEAGAGVVCALNAEMVGDALAGVLEDLDKAAQMGASGAKLVRENYTWPRIARQTIEAYHMYRARKAEPVKGENPFRTIPAA